MDSWEFFYAVVFMSVNCQETLKNCLALARKVVCMVSFLGKDPKSRKMNFNKFFKITHDSLFYQFSTEE